jgi:hypothetical protein
MTHDPTRDCEHGRLKGKCDVCDLQAEAEADKTIIEYHEATIERLNKALAAQPAPVQEPVAVVSGYYGGQCVVLPTNPARLFNSGTAFYTAPQPVPVKTYHDGKPWPVQPKPWVGLTKDDVESWDLPVNPTVFEFVQFIEAKLKEKNT